MTESRHATDYTERESRAARMVLTELMQILGSFRAGFALVGGTVPWLLHPDADPAHVGSMDIDLDLDPIVLAGGEYARLVETLERAGYRRGVEGMREFQLMREVAVDRGEPIGVPVDLLMPRGEPGDRNIEKLVPGLRVQQVDGGRVALEHTHELSFDGVMPDGRPNRVRVRMVTVPGFLVMKGFALDQRDKPKDAYDLWFAIRNHPGGPAALADECRLLLADAKAREGFTCITRKFRSRDDFGPRTVREFVAGSAAGGEMDDDQVQTDAFGQVSAWVGGLELGGEVE